MRIPSDDVRKQICETIIQFYTEAPPIQDVQRHFPNTLQYNQRIVEKSDVAETLVKSLTLLETDVGVKIAVLNALQHLSCNSCKISLFPQCCCVRCSEALLFFCVVVVNVDVAVVASNCNMMLRAEAAQRLCSRLMDYDPSGQILFRSVDIIWNLLDRGSHEEVAVQLNNFACIWFESTQCNNLSRS